MPYDRKSDRIVSAIQSSGNRTQGCFGLGHQVPTHFWGSQLAERQGELAENDDQAELCQCVES